MKNRNKSTKFPVARIKKIMQKDEEVGKVAQATPVVISKALELFLSFIVGKTNEVTAERGSRKVESYHLKHAVENTEILDFLKDLVEAIPDPSAGGTIDLEAEAESKKKRGKGKRAAAPVPTVPEEGEDPAPKRRRRKKGEANPPTPPTRKAGPSKSVAAEIADTKDEPMQDPDAEEAEVDEYDEDEVPQNGGRRDSPSDDDEEYERGMPRR